MQQVCFNDENYYINNFYVKPLCTTLVPRYRTVPQTVVSRDG